MKTILQTFLPMLFCLFLATGEVMAQEVVTGRVVAASDGEPIPSANVLIKGTTRGTITDMEGRYTLEVPGQDAVILVTFIGYLDAEEQVGQQNEINFYLEEEVSSLDEVVVVGYGVQKKSDLTGAITQVKNEDLTESAVPGLDQALQGRAAGVQVTNNSGMPGDGVVVTIRGMGTWNDSDPLYVVDGMPVENDISFLNPADIETVEVLKDASAAAIYGARAANGVVLITTRSGTVNKNMVSFDMYTGIQDLWRQVDVTDAEGYTSIYNQIQVTNGYNPDLPAHDRFFIPDSLAGGTTNWQDEIFRQALMQNYNLSFTGGNERVTYGVTGNYIDQEGIMKATGYRRFTFRANTDIHVSDKLTVGERFSVGMSDQSEARRGGGNAPHLIALLGDPLAPVYRDPSHPDYDYETARWGALEYSRKPNPVGILERLDNQRLKTPLILNSYLDYEFIEGLTFRVNGGLNLLFHDYTDFSQTYYEGGISQNELTQMNRRHWKNLSWLFESTLNYQRTFGEDHHLELLGGFSRQYSTIEDFRAKKVEFPGNEEYYRYLNFGTEIVLPSDVTGTKTESAIESLFGRMNYTFRDRYLLTASVRRDGSSRFGPDSEPLYGTTPRYDLFPSMALAWKISNESFFEDNIKTINFMKLRLGWGQLGNDRTVKGNDYPWFSAVETNRNLQNYVLGGEIVSGGVIVGKAVRDIRWERSTQYNAGLDINFFRNKLTFTGDVYRKVTRDQLVAVPLPWVVGVFNNPEDTKLGSDPLLNAGAVLNQGFEFLLTYKDKKGDLSYEAGINLSHNYNEVLELGTGNETIQSGRVEVGYASVTQPGYPIASFWGYKTDGLFSGADDRDGDGFVDNQPYVVEESDTTFMQPYARPGDVRFVDVSGDSVLNADDKTIIGSPHPDFTFGVNLRCRYRGFDLTMFWQGIYGSEIFSSLTNHFLGGNPSTNFHTDALDAYRSPSDDGSDMGNTDTRIPRLDGGQENQNFRISDLYIMDGSYLRLKNVQLGYTLPGSLVSLAGISRFRIYVAAQNLLTFTSYRYGYEPEIGRSYNYYGLAQEKFNQSTLELAIDRGVYPQARTYMVGLNVTF